MGGKMATLTWNADWYLNPTLKILTIRNNRKLGSLEKHFFNFIRFVTDNVTVIDLPVEYIEKISRWDIPENVKSKHALHNKHTFLITYLNK